jgi:hypothetical protein
LVIASLQFITNGVVAELLTRTYFESAHQKPYVIRDRSGYEPSWADPSSPDDDRPS